MFILSIWVPRQKKKKKSEVLFPLVNMWTQFQGHDLSFYSSQLAKIKKVDFFHTHKIYWVETVGLSLSNYTFKKFNLKILLHMTDKYKCDYLPHITLCFYLINFKLNTDFLFQFWEKLFSQKLLLKEQNPIFSKMITSNLNTYTN